MFRPSDDAFFALGKSAAAVGHLDKFLQALEPEEAAKLQQLAEAALFDEAQLNAARIQYGRLQLVRELRRNLAAHVASYEQQHMR